MIKSRLLNAALVGTCLIGISPAAAQTEPMRGFSNLAVPSPDVTPQPGYVKALARTAYIWGWPMVSMLNRYESITKAPEAGLLGGVVPVAPRGRIAMLHDYIAADERFVACPNQDVVYGLGFFDLDAQPVVVQVPDFGDRFWVYAAYDQRTDQFGHLGKPYGTSPGFYLLTGPNWHGKVPDGIADVIRSATSIANLVPRVFMNDTQEDRKAIQGVINQVVVYPLSEFDGRMKVVDWSKLPSIPNPAPEESGETRWVVPEKFFDDLRTVLDQVSPLPGEEAMYAQFRWLLQLGAKHPALKAAMIEAAIEADKDVITPFFQWQYNGKPAGNHWNRSLHNAEWGVDYFDRTGTARSNMFDNRPNETQYFYTDFDTSGVKLNSSKSYTVTFSKAEEPPVNGFWSLTVYDKLHFFGQNKLKRYSLGSKNTDLKRNDDGSLTLYVSATLPKGAPQSNWLPAPKGDFSLYIRAYWGQSPILEGTWQPPAVKVAE